MVTWSNTIPKKGLYVEYTWRIQFFPLKTFAENFINPVNDRYDIKTKADINPKQLKCCPELFISFFS